jgi:hypothetical protein
MEGENEYSSWNNRSDMINRQERRDRPDRTNQLILKNQVKRGKSEILVRQILQATKVIKKGYMYKNIYPNK